jgi:hypothetical protein
MNDEGFVTAELLFMIAIITLCICGYAMLSASVLSYRNAAVRRYDAENEASAVLDSVTEYIQCLTEDASDSAVTPGVQAVLSKFSSSGLTMEDVSSGINRRFLSTGILDSRPVKELLSVKGKRAEVTYGWISAGFASRQALKAVQESFGTDDNEKLFPLVNTLPLCNIHFLDTDCTAALLSAENIPHAADKAFLLYSKSRSGVLREAEIAGILGVKTTHPVTGLIGTKTAFWKICFHTERCSAEAVYAAVPFRKKTSQEKMIEKYVLVERRIHDLF